MEKWLSEASPLVVVGMHRSGTRLLADLLNRLGIFMGADQQADSESVTFMLINEGILHQCGAFWSEPMSAHFALSQPEFAEQMAASVREVLAAQLPGFIGHSGGGSLSALGQAQPFGWKDPRNTFTLPVWRQVFPNLRAVHIVRHGVDVAASLSRRHAKALREATGDSTPPALTVIRDDALGVLSSRRGWTLAEALTMWEQYIEKARLELAELPGRALEVRFEDLVLDPGQVVAEVAEFCGVGVPDSPDTILSDIKAGRACAFRGDPGLVEFAGSMAEILGRYGYSA